jgi:hypothetical protein
MPEIVFNTPMGRQQVNPSPKSLRDLVLSRSDDFWAAGSGSAALDFKGEEVISRLLLMGRDGAGFFLVYESSENESFCPRKPSATAKAHDSLPVYVGGEPMDVPRKNFLDKETTCRVLADFLYDGKRSPQVEWEAWQ